jgi:hypothetical protein
VEGTVYKIIEPPFTLRFGEMSKPELREYYRWFLQMIPSRIAELTGAVKRTPGFEDWKSDFSPSSLDALGNWFGTQVETRARTEEELDELAAKLPLGVSNRELTNRTISLCVDIAMYLSQIVLQNNSALKWDQNRRAKKYIDYGQPVLVGFIDKIPINPVRVISTFAYGLNDKTYTGNRLREIYNSIQGIRLG